MNTRLTACPRPRAYGRSYGLITLACWLVITGLSGCTSHQPVSSNVLVFDRSQALPARSRPFTEPAGALNQQQVIQVVDWLQRAEQALRDKRLTTPERQNALFYYRQVLAQQPHNEEARKGLARIVERYLQWHEAAVRSGRYQQAAAYLRRAQRVRPDDPAIARAARQGETLRREAAAEAKARAVDAETPVTTSVGEVKLDAQGYISLDRTQLSKRSSQVRQQLAAIAELARSHNSRLTIEAPDDASARWVYQQLNNHSEDFRVRANLKIAAQPGVRLLDY